MQLDPTIPGWWDGFKMRYRHGEAIYDIQVENPEHCERGVSFVELDGQGIKDGVIPLGKDLIKHRVLVRMGTSAHSGGNAHRGGRKRGNVDPRPK